MDPYSVLGVAPGASQEEIKKAYRTLVKKYHPDKFSGTDLEEVAKEKLQEINEAYKVLTSGNAGRTSYGGASDTGSSQSSFQHIRRLINSGSIAEAQSLLNTMQTRPAEWYFLSGIIYQRKGWYAEAASHFQTAASMDPGNVEYRNALSSMRNTYTSYRSAQPTYGRSSMSGCDLCSSLICADCLCECCGGDLISCC